MTIIYSVDTNHDAKMSYQHWSQKIIFYVNKQVIWLAGTILGLKPSNLAVKLHEITKSIYVVSMDA